MDNVNNISATEAYEILSSDPESQLIDVRTLPEWSFCGIPDLEEVSKQPKLISWLQYPEMSVNENFLSQLDKEQVNKQTKLLFLCKVGGRSAQAASFCKNNGFENCYNIEAGFEGDKNENNQRAKLNGWKADGLPWQQS